MQSLSLRMINNEEKLTTLLKLKAGSEGNMAWVTNDVYLLNKQQFIYFLFLFQRLYLNSSFRGSLTKFLVQMNFGDQHLNLT
jgi:hypothetical protein